MDWKDTVLTEKQAIKAYENPPKADDHAVGCVQVARAQAEITSFQSTHPRGVRRIW